MENQSAYNILSNKIKDAMNEYVKACPDERVDVQLSVSKPVPGSNSYTISIASLTSVDSEASGNYLRSLDNINPDDEPAYKIYEDIDALLGTGNNEAAIELSSKAIEIYPSDPKLYISLGRAYWASGKLSEAEQEMSHAIHLCEQREVKTADDVHQIAFIRSIYAMFLKGIDKKAEANAQFEAIIAIAEKAGMGDQYQYMNDYIES